MLRKEITYTDYDGKERTEEFYFNLSKSEVIEMEMSSDGGLETTIKKMIENKDNKKTLEMVKDFILRSYGEKSKDGKRFIKTQELRDAFYQSEAYVTLFMEFVTNGKYADEFITSVVGLTPEQIASLPNREAV